MLFELYHKHIIDRYDGEYEILPMTREILEKSWYENLRKYVTIRVIDVPEKRSFNPTFKSVRQLKAGKENHSIEDLLKKDEWISDYVEIVYSVDIEADQSQEYLDFINNNEITNIERIQKPAHHDYSTTPYTNYPIPAECIRVSYNRKEERFLVDFSNLSFVEYLGIYDDIGIDLDGRNSVFQDARGIVV